MVDIVVVDGVPKELAVVAAAVVVVESRHRKELECQSGVLERSLVGMMVVEDKGSLPIS